MKWADQKFNSLFEKISEIKSEVKVATLTVGGGGVGFGVLTVVAHVLHWI